MPKIYSLDYYLKQKLSFDSKPEDFISDLVRNPDKHPVHIGFETRHDFLNEVYMTWRKRMKSVHAALFPTPMDVASRLAECMNIGDENTVFDPGAGLGNLLRAAAGFKPQRAFGLEIQHWLPQTVNAVANGDYEVQRGDWLQEHAERDERLREEVDMVIVNPPYGRVFDEPDACSAFMRKIGDVFKPGTTVGAILPEDYFENGPKKRRDSVKNLKVVEQYAVRPDAFNPLTNIQTEIIIYTIEK